MLATKSVFFLRLAFDLYSVALMILAFGCPTGLYNNLALGYQRLFFSRRSLFTVITTNFGHDFEYGLCNLWYRIFLEDACARLKPDVLVAFHFFLSLLLFLFYFLYGAFNYIGMVWLKVWYIPRYWFSPFMALFFCS
jgi:hypothetical protein